MYKFGASTGNVGWGTTTPTVITDDVTLFE